MSEPTLSVCTIVRNEASNLPRCLASVVDVAHEVLVTDTGSTDDTVALAEAAGASVDHFTWIDDFSAAYTHCVRRARCDWILLIDADEALLHESVDELRRAIRTDHAFAFSVLRQDLADGERPDVYSEMRQSRLWRTRAAVSFVGRIHHQFAPPLKDLAAAESRGLYESTIRLRHWGYTDQDKRPKLVRAERLMTLELEDRPDQFYYHVELGRTRIALGDTTGVDLLRIAAQQVVDNDQQVANAPGQFAMLLEHLLACDQLPGGFPISLDEAERIAVQRFPEIDSLAVAAGAGAIQEGSLRRVRRVDRGDSRVGASGRVRPARELQPRHHGPRRPTQPRRLLRAIGSPHGRVALLR